MDKIFLLKNILTNDIIDYIISFEFNINDSITTDNLYIFKILSSNIEKKDIMSWFILAIKFNSYYIINYMIDNHNKILRDNYFYNNYPLEFYAQNRKTRNQLKKIRYNQNNGENIENNKIEGYILYKNITTLQNLKDEELIKSRCELLLENIISKPHDNYNCIKTLRSNIIYYLSKKSIENDLVGISRIIFNKDGIIKLDIIEEIISNHNHRIFFINEYIYKRKNFFNISIKSIILKVIECLDLYMLSKFSNNKNVLNVFIDECNFKESNNYLKVYENHDDNLLPIIKEMTRDNFLIRCIEIINQNEYLEVNIGILYTMYKKYKKLFPIMIKKLDIDINKLILYIQLIYENLIKNKGYIYLHKDNIIENKESIKFKIGKNRYLIDNNFSYYDDEKVINNRYATRLRDIISPYDMLYSEEELILNLKKIEEILHIYLNEI